MKELSIEEKAKAYDKAIERANSLLSGNQLGNAWIYKLLPELAESEDERIREELKEVLDICLNVRPQIIKEPQYLKFINWLEKQGEQPKKHDVCDNCEQQGSCVSPCPMKLVEKHGEQNLVKHFCDCVHVGCHVNDCKRWCHSYQKEISYTDCNSNCNRYSKLMNHAFNIGETITDGISTFKIVDIKDNHYIADDGERVEIYMAHRYYTIIQNLEGQKPAEEYNITGIGSKNAKGKLGEMIKRKQGEQKPTAKYKVGDTVYYDSFGRLVSFVIANIVEDGTDNPIYEDKDGNSVFQNDIVEQNPAWSEEDEKMFRGLIVICDDWTIRHSFYPIENCDMEKLKNWFKSLKDRVLSYPKQEWKQENTGDLTDFENAMMHIGGSFFGQHAGLDPNDTNAIKEQANLLLELVPKQEWSEEDSEMFGYALDMIEWYGGKNENKVRLVSNWLKFLKERIQPQTKQEWSEEDERLCLCLIEDQEEALDKVRNDKYGHSEIISDLKEMYHERIAFLKSLKDRYTWKPSEEQMEALEHAINCYSGISPTNTEEVYTLEIMKEKLKKLREK